MAIKHVERANLRDNGKEGERENTRVRERDDI